MVPPERNLWWGGEAADRHRPRPLRRRPTWDPLRDQADPHGEVEVGPRTIGSQDLCRIAAHCQRQATPIPSERLLPPSSDRMAPANSASSSRTGSMPTRRRRAARELDRRRLRRPPASRSPQPDWLPPERLNGAQRRPTRRQARRARGQGPLRHRGPSPRTRSREATLGQQLIDQRALLRNFRRQPPKLCHCVLLSFEHDSSTHEVQVQPITRGKPESRADLGRDDETTLLTENECTSSCQDFHGHGA
jgi:hypothetical protein